MVKRKDPEGAMEKERGSSFLLEGGGEAEVMSCC